MIISTEISLDKIILHKVGNRHQDEGIRFSKSPLELDDEIKELLLTYFISPFKTEEYYNLFHESDIKLNEVFSFVSSIFDDPTTIFEQSENLARHLYECSAHPKIKSGEFYVTYLQDCVVDGERMDAVGLFKSESKDTFLKVYPSGDNFAIDHEDGINIHKLDKGCLIFNTEKESGYLVATVDTISKGNDAVYWKDDFLKVLSRQDEYHHTENMIQLCKTFVEKQLPEDFEVSKVDQAAMLNRTSDFLKQNESFAIEDFAGEVMQEPELIQSFKNFKSQFENDKEIQIANDFEISNSALKKQARFMKSVIKLDKNFHIYVHGKGDYIKKGVDSTTGLNYYQLFFEEEN